MRIAFLLSRSIFAFSFLLILLSASSAVAGTASYKDEKGSWVSTACKCPETLAVVPHDPEAAADELNARFLVYKKYVEDAQNYMNCISSEAQKDANATAGAIVHAAEAEINKAHANAEKMVVEMEKIRKQLLAGK
ncbi:MAG: hypothetical protein PHX43_05520 [Alphaproteobacteria bacterium]|nr:hypothetical protein [Alphaproteobacteria bacterium]